VVSGDTLGDIANRYRVSLYSLRQANGLNGDTIRVGSQLVIPTT
jgi:LysM repeat protein